MFRVRIEYLNENYSTEVTSEGTPYLESGFLIIPKVSTINEIVDTLETYSINSEIISSIEVGIIK